MTTINNIIDFYKLKIKSTKLYKIKINKLNLNFHIFVINFLLLF